MNSPELDRISELSLQGTTGVKYQEWYSLMARVLQAAELWDIVSGNEPRLLEDPSAIQAWDCKDKQAVMAIIMKMETCLYFRLCMSDESVGTATGLWAPSSRGLTTAMQKPWISKSRST